MSQVDPLLLPPLVRGSGMLWLLANDEWEIFKIGKLIWPPSRSSGINRKHSILTTKIIWLSRVVTISWLYLIMHRFDILKLFFGLDIAMRPNIYFYKVENMLSHKICNALDSILDRDWKNIQAHSQWCIWFRSWKPTPLCEEINVRAFEITFCCHAKGILSPVTQHSNGLEHREAAKRKFWSVIVI